MVRHEAMRASSSAVHFLWMRSSPSGHCLSAMPACLPSGLMLVRLCGLVFFLSPALPRSFPRGPMLSGLGCRDRPSDLFFLLSPALSPSLSPIWWDAVSASLAFSFSCTRSPVRWLSKTAALGPCCNSLLWGLNPWPYAYGEHALPAELKRPCCWQVNGYSHAEHVLSFSMWVQPPLASLGPTGDLRALPALRNLWGRCLCAQCCLGT